MSPEDNIGMEMDRLQREAFEEQERTKKVVREMRAEMTRIALKYYPLLLEVEAPRIRELGEMTARIACEFSTGLEMLVMVE